MGKNKNKRKRNKQKRHSTYRFTGYIFLALLVVAMMAKAGYETYINSILKKRGICTEAIVYNRHKSGKGMSVTSHYHFTWKGITHYGKSYNDTKYEEETGFNDKFIIGDTITIVLLENDPSTNRSNSLIKKDCHCANKNNKRQP